MGEKCKQLSNNNQKSNPRKILNKFYFSSIHKPCGHGSGRGLAKYPYYSIVHCIIGRVKKKLNATE